MKKNGLLLVLSGIFLMTAAMAYADCSMGKACHRMKEKQSENQCPIVAKVLKKSHALLEHKSDLALTDDQVKSIKEITLQSEKDSATQGAEMKIFMLELQSKLHEDKVDVDGVKALIDKNFPSFAASAKTNVESYAKLQNVLTPEQIQKAKGFMKEGKKSWKHEAGEKAQ